MTVEATGHVAAAQAGAEALRARRAHADPERLPRGAGVGLRGEDPDLRRVPLPVLRLRRREGRDGRGDQRRDEAEHDEGRRGHGGGAGRGAGVVPDHWFSSESTGFIASSSVRTRAIQPTNGRAGPRAGRSSPAIGSLPTRSVSRTVTVVCGESIHGGSIGRPPRLLYGEAP